MPLAWVDIFLTFSFNNTIYCVFGVWLHYNGKCVSDCYFLCPILGHAIVLIYDCIVDFPMCGFCYDIING